MTNKLNTFKLNYLQKIIKPFINAWRFIKSKDNSFIFSTIAIILSVVSIVYAFYQGNVDISHERYDLWNHISESLDRQESTDSKIYPILLKEIVKSKQVLLGVHGDSLTCSYIADFSGSDSNLNLTINSYFKNAVLGQMESEEQYGLQNIVLENNHLADALSVNGWSPFLKDEHYSNKWWSTLSWSTMQLGFFPSQWSYECAGTDKKRITKIKITKRSIQTFKADLRLAILDDTYIQDQLTPNLVSLKTLEGENMPHPIIEYGRLDSIFGPLNKDDIKQDSPLKIMVNVTSELSNIIEDVYAKQKITPKNK